VTLTMRPHALLSRGSHEVMHGEWQVGQIEKRSSLYGPEERWIWALNGVPAAGPEGMRRAGNTATLDEAEAALKESWELWLAWANLSTRPASHPPPAA
jgi:hypothetical protein